MKPTVESNAELVNTQLHTRNYRDFRPFTSKTDYPHQPIIAYGEKKFNKLPALVDNLHLRSKENLYKKAPEFTSLEANLY